MAGKKKRATAPLDEDKRAKAIMNEQCERILRRIDDATPAGSEKPPRGEIKRIIQEEKKIIPSLTEDMIRQRRKRKEQIRRKEESMAMKRRKDAEEARVATAIETRNLEFRQQQFHDEIVQPAPSVIPQKSPWVGRKPGSTNKAKSDYQERLKFAVDDCVVTQHNFSINNIQCNLKDLIDFKKDAYGLDPDERISESTIRSRIVRHRKYGSDLVVESRGNKSPIAAVEPTLCCILKYASRLGCYVSQRHCIRIVNELIKGKFLAQEVKHWKMRFNPATRKILAKHPNYPVSADVGWGWFCGFRGRYKEITSKYVTNVKHYRSTWSSYAMLLDMYKIVYGLFLKWNLAIALPTPQWQDINGKEVSEEEALGSRVEYKLLYPERILTMDEAGDRGNQSDDKANRSNKVVVEADGTQPKIGSSVDDTAWTIQAYTTLEGQAVLYVIIIKKGSCINFNEYHGFDLQAKWIGDGEEECKNGVLPTQEQINRNMGEGRRWPGPLTCKFNGVTIPSLVFASTGGGVNDDILVKSLKHLDDLNVFPRKDGLPNPTLLVDGHGSRLQPKFVQYINNLKEDWTPDEEACHKWNVALGLPHSTHHWQVADSSELNQTFKAASREVKDRIRNFQDEMNMTPAIKNHHIVPICNHAFKKSFHDVQKVKKAVAMRGWNPLNMNCLHSKDIQRTKVIDNNTYHRGKPPTPAELAIAEQGPEIIDQFNWDGNITKQVFERCSKKMERYKAQDEELRKRRQEQRARGESVFNIVGRATSGKLYENGIATVNDENLIDHLKAKQDEINQKQFERECRIYTRKKKLFDKGHAIMAKIAEKEEMNPGKDVSLTVTELNTLLRWKWEAVGDHQRPKYSILKCGRDHKIQLWNYWKKQQDPCPPLQPPDYELYLDGVGVEQVHPNSNLHPVHFPSISDTQGCTQGDTQEDIENDDPDDVDHYDPFQRQCTGFLGTL